MCWGWGWGFLVNALGGRFGTKKRVEFPWEYWRRSNLPVYKYY